MGAMAHQEYAKVEQSLFRRATRRVENEVGAFFPRIEAPQSMRSRSSGLMRMLRLSVWERVRAWRSPASGYHRAGVTTLSLRI